MATYFKNAPQRPHGLVKVIALALWFYVTVNAVVVLLALPAMRRLALGGGFGNSVDANLGPLPLFRVSKAEAADGYNLIFQLRYGLLIWLIICIALAVGYRMLHSRRNAHARSRSL